VSKLDEAIDELDKIMSGVATDMPSPDKVDVAIVVKARVKVAKLYGDMMEALKDDARLRANANLHSEFAERFKERRHTIARLQTTWPMAALQEDIAGYFAELKPTIAGNREFVAWARSALRQA